ncbi:MAG: glycosyltransferase family 4 protein [Thiobacillus sp.]|nr:glycosyltransferase family 4 protein [Thiobacillus sp.]
MKAASHRPQSVCIIQPVMKQYRVPFFLELEKALAAKGIDLVVVYGTPWRGEAERGDHAELPPPLGVKVNSSMLLGKLLLIPVLRPWLRADLVVVEHANKNLLNYLLAILRGLRLKRVAFWSHGRDRQADSASLGERFKRRTLHWADWWFAYTAESAAYVEAQGYPKDRITVVENAIDTRALRADLDAVSDEELQAIRTAFGWNGTEQVAVFCGSLYRNKRLDLLFEAADRVQREVPAFRLIVIGGGPLAEAVAEFARHRAWVQAVGPKFGHEKSVILKLACMWLNPGALGLGILDAFCAGMPLLTTRQSTHGPEIEYLQHEVNGLLLDDAPEAYADGMLRLLRDEDLAARLREGAMASAQRYSIETMVRNFSNGVRACLSLS